MIGVIIFLILIGLLYLKLMRLLRRGMMCRRLKRESSRRIKVRGGEDEMFDLLWCLVVFVI